MIDEQSGEKIHEAEAIVFLHTGECLELIISGHGNVELIKYVGATLDIIKIG